MSASDLNARGDGAEARLFPDGSMNGHARTPAAPKEDPPENIFLFYPNLIGETSERCTDLRSH